MSVSYRFVDSSAPQDPWLYANRDADCLDYDHIIKVSRNVESLGELTDFSVHNRTKLKEYLAKVKDCKVILEIGVENNPNRRTSTSVLLDNKPDDCYYFGIDIEDKSFLNNEEKNIYTYRTRSENISEVMAFLNSKGKTKIDFLFIDGWHSINQVLKEFEYVEWLSEGGIVGLHDTNHHPGPKYLIEKIDQTKWEVFNYPSEDPMFDFGIAFVRKKV